MNNKLIVIQGATATGKSKLSELLAAKFDAEIISADSRQVYTYLDIGTAKPDQAIRKKIPHHLIDIVYPDQKYDAGCFLRDAASAARDILSRGKIPIITGGTGFYIKSFLNGLAWIPPVDLKAQKKVAELLSQNDNKYVYNLLQDVDPDAAQKISENDLHRQQRALEVFFSSGKPLSSWWKSAHQAWPGSCLNILLQRDRPGLYHRINQRIDLMIELGLIEEIKSLLARGYSETDPGMISVGYREFYPWLRGQGDFDAALSEAKQHSRNYAKRQFTWYKKQVFDLTIDAENLNLYLLVKKVEKYLEKGE